MKSAVEAREINLSSDCLRVPIVIAVTGHRDAQNEGELTAAVNRFLEWIKLRYPSTPLRLLSGLAAGADRLVAAAALNQGLELIAVLPLPVAEYEKDFVAEESLQEFRRLLSRSSRQIEIDMKSTGDASRSARYARQGEYLIENCDLLLALWDGEASDKQGGTADVVRYRLQGVPRQVSRSGSYLERRRGDVYQVVTPRSTASKNPVSPGSIYYHSTDGRRRPISDLEPDPSLAAIDRFNRDVGIRAKSSDAGVLLPLDRKTDWLARFSMTDQLAIDYQTRTWRAFSLMLVFSGAALICFQLQSAIPGSSSLSFAGYVCFLLAAYGVYGWSKHQQLESRAFDYRALAEGIRIQIVWREAGLNAGVADYYLNRQQDVLRWIRRALLNWESAAPFATEPEHVTVESLQRTLDDWIRNQIRFFSKAVLKQRAWHTCFFSVANGLMLVSMLLGFFQPGLDAAPWQAALASLLPIVAATLIVFAKTRAWSEQVHQYKNMQALFEAGEDRLQDLISRGELAAGRQLLVELGREALAENADWLNLHRSRPISTPSSG